MDARPPPRLLPGGPLSVPAGGAAWQASRGVWPTVAGVGEGLLVPRTRLVVWPPRLLVVRVMPTVGRPALPAAVTRALAVAAARVRAPVGTPAVPTTAVAT